MSGKTEITLLKSTALWGQTLLCPNKWKTRATLAEWDTARSRVSRSRRRRPSLERQTRLITTGGCVKTGWTCVRHSACLIHWEDCRPESCRKLADGSANSDEILCKHLWAVNWGGGVMVLAKGNAESNKPLLLFVRFMSLRAFLVIPHFEFLYKIMVFCTAVLDVILVSSECDYIFDFPSGADNPDTSPHEESVQRWALCFHNPPMRTFTMSVNSESLMSHRLDN